MFRKMKSEEDNPKIAIRLFESQKGSTQVPDSPRNLPRPFADGNDTAEKFNERDFETTQKKGVLSSAVKP